jgi:hypothetical protein
MTEDDAAKRDRYERATASGLGALVGAAISGPAAPLGAVVGATLGPLLEPMAVRIRDELASDARKRGGEVLAAAVEATGSSEEELERLIQSGDETRLLAGIALSAASRTTFEGKLRALGYSLAYGLLAENRAIINVEQMIIAAIGDIEEPHLCLLDVLVHYEPPRGEDQPHPKELDIPDYSYSEFLYSGWYHVRREWPETLICSFRPRLAIVIESLIGTLDRHGLARWDTTSAEVTDDPNLLPTELGELTWRRFRDAGARIPDVWLAQDIGREG